MALTIVCYGPYQEPQLNNEMYAKRAQTILNLELAKRLNDYVQASTFIRSCAVARPQKTELYQTAVRPHFTAQFYSTVPEVDTNTFERVCEETLSSLADYFEDLVASDAKLQKGDVMYGVGVLTIDLGPLGTYVVNRQSPNKQIWLSSPTSGPKRFDYVTKEDCWVYRHDGQTLHGVLKKEFESLLGRELSVSNCAHSSSIA